MNTYSRLDQIGGKIGQMFGLGFFVHDIALCAQTNRLYLLESGFKLHDRSWLYHVGCLSDKTVIITKLVHEFIRQTGAM